MAFESQMTSDLSDWNQSLDVAWDGSTGYPTAGCAAFSHSLTLAGGVINVNPAYVIQSGDEVGFYWRSNLSEITPFGDIFISCQVVTGSGAHDFNISTAGISAGDTGWQLATFSLAAYVGETVNNFQIATANTDWNGVGTVYADNARLGSALPAVSYSESRYLGLAADSGELYLTSITGGSITYNSIAQDTLTSDGTATFGAAAYTDPDTFTAGLFPVTRPGSDLVVYLYGRDGNSVQVQYNDLNGTLGWVDVGAGTATWGTAKFAVALMPDQGGPDDVIVAFSDNDVYRTETGTATWTKQGDATSNLRTAARHPTTPENLYLAGTASGTMFYSPNMGVSYSSIGGTAVAGTINAIEVSR